MSGEHDSQIGMLMPLSLLLQEIMPPRAGRMLSSALLVSATLLLHATVVPTAEADWGLGWVNRRLQGTSAGQNKYPGYLGRPGYDHPNDGDEGNEGNEGKTDVEGGRRYRGEGSNEGNGGSKGTGGSKKYPGYLSLSLIHI